MEKEEVIENGEKPKIENEGSPPDPSDETKSLEKEPKVSPAFQVRYWKD